MFSAVQYPEIMNRMQRDIQHFRIEGAFSIITPALYSSLQTASIIAKKRGGTMRPDWDSYFMKIASAVSERSTCDRAFVGCVLVLDKRILTTGFNGSPAGQEHCDEIGHLIVEGHCVRTIHAETNAIIQAALHGVSTRGATCYVTHLPCINCTKALINAGITRIVYGEAYRVDENAMAFLKAADIEVMQHQNGYQNLGD